MNIKYLTQLSNNPSIPGKTPGFVKTLQPITIDEVVNLETKYNAGNTFPLALRELLLLAGNYCYVLDYGSSSQEDLQDDSRGFLTENDLTISRPFYVIDVYNSLDQFLFIYLDSGNDPEIFAAEISDIPVSSDYEFPRSLNKTLSDYINGLTLALLSGGNPF